MSYQHDNVLAERYRVETVITTTELSMVYTATDLLDAREVVVKVARHGQCDDAEHCPTCWNLALEGVVLRRLNHHTIPAPRYLGQFHTGGRPFLAMSKISGHNLEELRREDLLSPYQALRLIIEVCEAVERLHRLGFVHQDIKPSNIMVRPDHTAVLIDWGSAERIRAPGDRRPYGSFTRQFASPEQVRGEALPGNDIFSLGRTLDSLVPWPSRRLAAIIQKATAPATRRYASVADLRRDLARLVALDTVTSLFDLAAI
jgi:serine/threonine protein kinase